MARITEAELQHLKAAVSLVTVVQKQGRQLFKKGKDFVLLCPFHEEKTPSMVISPAKNLYHCFGCDAGGSVLDWLMKTEHISLTKAANQLRAETGITSISDPLPALSINPSESEQQALFAHVVSFYHQTLLSSPEAIAYLEKRRLNHPELVAQFRLGFANRTLGYQLPPKKHKAGGIVREQLQALGVLRDTGHEHLYGSVVVPIFDDDGNVCGMYGRKITEGFKKAVPLHLYLAGSHRGVWNAAGLAGCKSIILCEALIDAMSFWVAGQRQVTAAYGVYGVTPDHWKLFADKGVKQVLIAFDNDQAGNDGAVKLAGELQEKGIEAWRIVFPVGEDANSYLCQVAEPGLEFRLLIEGAVRMGDVPERAEAEELDAYQTEGVSAPREEVTEFSAPGLITEMLPCGSLQVTMGPHQWQLRGLAGIRPGGGRMKLNIRLLDTGSGVCFTDSLDLLSARSRAAYAKLAAVDLGCSEGELRRGLGQLVMVMETLPQSGGERQSPASEMSDEEREAALLLLQSPRLTEQVADDMSICGMVGERVNLLAAYLAAISRKLERPLAILVQSNSAAGKSSLMDAVLSLMPEEERLHFSAMTGQSLFYLGETNLKHKILSIAEEEGIRQAAYALKLLQSDGELTIASTGKDDATGELVTKEYHVEGPVMLMLTTTASDVDEELLNRCLVLTVNESREQTEAIHERQRQRQTLEGLLAGNEKTYLTQLHQNAQRLLRPLNVVNPYASQLTFVSSQTRTRRDHMKYLTLIQSIALLHQYQREIKTVHHRGQALEYIEVALSDIALANQLCHEILGRTLDEMPPQSRKLLLLIQEQVRQWGKARGQPAREIRFTRRDLREALTWSDNQLKVHCQRLTELEYLMVHGGSRGHLLRYELLWDGEETDKTHLCGLIDVDALAKTDEKRQYNPRKLDSEHSKLEVNNRKLAPSLPQVGIKLGSSCGEEISL